MQTKDEFRFVGNNIQFNLECLRVFNRVLIADMQACCLVYSRGKSAFASLSSGSYFGSDAEHATGVELERRVRTVKLHWVRRLGKFA